MPTTQSHDGHQYDALFYNYQREGSLRSARVVLPHICHLVPVRSVLDVGCGAGAWLSVWHSLGVTETCGVDGDYVDRNVLLIDRTQFQPQDISQRFDSQREFDLVMCLEVAEHVPAAKSATLVDNLVRHGKVVLFSAAVPGQGGEDHINEQPYEYWRDLFAQRGFRLFDCVRPAIAGDVHVEHWYRYNLLLFVHDDSVASLSPEASATRVPETSAITDRSPMQYRLRKALLRFLPGVTVTRLAVWKHQRFVRALRRSTP